MLITCQSVPGSHLVSWPAIIMPKKITSGNVGHEVGAGSCRNGSKCMVMSRVYIIIYVCICHAVCSAAMCCLFCEADVTPYPRWVVLSLKTEEAGRACVS